MEFKEGYTLDYLAHGVFLVLIGLGVLYYSFAFSFSSTGIVYGVIMIVLAIILFTIQSGIEINQSSLKIRSYKYLLGIKIGKWISLQDCKYAKLRYVDETQRMNSRGSTNTYTTKTYNLRVHIGEKEILIYEFTNKKLALQSLDFLNKKLNVPIKQVG